MKRETEKRVGEGRGKNDGIEREKKEREYKLRAM